MAQPSTNPKIEELRFRLKADAKSRLFFPLAEELRKIGQYAEAEQVLRTGLTHHPTYLSAWVSLGRVLRDNKNDAGAVEALNRALQLDPGNVVAARLLADAYLNLGDKVEAIKKYKLVQALMPGDDDLTATIEKLEGELTPPAPAPGEAAAQEPAAPPEPALPDAAPAPVLEFPAAEETVPVPAPPMAETLPPELAARSFEPFSFAPAETAEPAVPHEAAASNPWADEPSAEPAPAEPLIFPGPADEAPVDQREAERPFESPAVPETAAPTAEEPSEEAAATVEEQSAIEERTRDFEPMHAEHTVSPFEDLPAEGGWTAAALEVESPLGIHVGRAPLAAEVPLPVTEEELPAVDAPPIVSERAGEQPHAVFSSDPLTPAIEEADVFAPAEVTAPEFGEARTGESAEAEPFGDEAAALAAEPEDITNTLTMADLYAGQGLVDDARQIYENILHRDPQNDAVRRKLSALGQKTALALEPEAKAARSEELRGAETPAASASAVKIRRLEEWLGKVGRREDGRV